MVSIDRDTILLIGAGIAVVFFLMQSGTLSVFGNTLNTDWHTQSEIEEYQEWNAEKLPAAINTLDDYRCGNGDDIKEKYGDMVRQFNNGIRILEDRVSDGNLQDFDDERRQAIEGLNNKASEIRFEAEEAETGDVCTGIINGNDDTPPQDTIDAVLEGLEYTGSDQFREVADRIESGEKPDQDGDGVFDAADACPETAGDTSDGCPDGVTGGDGTGSGGVGFFEDPILYLTNLLNSVLRVIGL